MSRTGSRIAGAALDVFPSEPMTENPLFADPRVVVTPHLGASTAEATDRGKWVHMGRVNTRQRLRYATHIGCDSADGTGMTRAPDKLLAQMLRWLEEDHGQLALFGAAA